MYLVSVVMTSYNHERYIAEAIESVLAQTYKHFELIIVDDASRDRSREVITEYQAKDSRIRTIFHENNKGISHTTNEGFFAAKGDCIAYMQSDDLWKRDKLEKQLDIFKNNNTLIIWTDAEIVNGDGQPTGQLFTERYRANHRPKSGHLFFSLLEGNYICGQSILFDRKLVGSFEFDPKLVFANDYKFMFQVSQQYEFYFIPETLVKYRIHDTNSIHKNRDIWDRDAFLINVYLIKKCADLISKPMNAKLHRRIGRYLYDQKHYRFAYRIFLKAYFVNRTTRSLKDSIKSYWKSLAG